MKPSGTPVKSRSWKDLPNKHFQQKMAEMHAYTDYMDGEVIIGDEPWAPQLFNRTQSAIMSQDGEPNFTVWMFDCWAFVNEPFQRRQERVHFAAHRAHSEGCNWIKHLYHQVINNYEELLNYEAACVETGYEGCMLRHIDGMYKFGRATLKQQGLIKVKRFQDAEATVIGFEPLYRNQNEQVRDAFGLAKRSSHSANMVPDALLGKLIVTAAPWGEFAIGSGLDVAARTEIWNRQDSYLGRTVTFKYQSHGTLERPRLPIFKGFRHD
jgi:DNA ligase-1